MTNRADQYDLQGSVEINGEFYELVRITGKDAPPGHLAYQEDFEDEPPWTPARGSFPGVRGAPLMISEQSNTWHLGGLKSRQGIAGTSEYGQNTDTRWAFRMLPSAKINPLTLTASDTPPLSIFEALGQVFVVCAKRVFRINPSTDIVTLSTSVVGGLNYIMGMRWESDYPLVTLDGANPIIKLTALGSPDSWTQSAAVIAYYLASGINRLFRINSTGNLKNIITGLDPMTEANWADSVQVGETGTLPTGLIAYERTVFAGKPEGLFGVGDNGFGLPVIRRMVRETDNCRGLAAFDPWLLVPHVRGLYRYTPGVVETIGIERELLNDSPINGRWKAFAVDGDWIYGALAVGSNTYIMIGREKRGGESNFSSIIWDTLLYFTGTCQAMWLSSLSTNPRLYFGVGNNVSYIELSASPGSVEYALTGSRYSTRIRFDDWNPKDFPRVDLVGKHLSATKYWTLNYSIDGGDYSALDINGATMKIIADGRQSFFLPTTTVGREIQLRFDYTSDSASVPPELNFVEVYGVYQSKKIPVLTFRLALEDGMRHGSGSDLRSAAEMFTDLQTLSASATAIVAKGPWSTTGIDVWVKKAKIIDLVQRSNSSPSMIVEVVMQKRGES